jgi:hypothetical protein
MAAVMDQIATEPAQRDLAWLRHALQTAIALEHSTLPLYSAAMLSLEVQNFPAYNVIRSVLMEEMVHMAIAANMLAGIGGRPRIKDLDPAYPRQGLVGGAEPDLHVGMARLSLAQLENFMRLEAPFFLLPDAVRHETYPTIARFYEAIKEAIAANADSVREAVRAGGPANQVGDNIGWHTLVPDGDDPVDQLYAGIDEILAQGEGSGSTTIETGADYGYEESHYAKFAELMYGQRYQEPSEPVELTGDTEPQFFKGTRIPWPVITNTLAVPSDGYDRLLAVDPAGPDVAAQLTEFDALYSGMLIHLDELWNGPEETLWPTFGEAVKAMTKLRVVSCFEVMRNEVSPEAIARLPELYPDEHDFLSTYTKLDEPVFYGPRFRNVTAELESGAIGPATI